MRQRWIKWNNKAVEDKVRRIAKLLLFYLLQSLITILGKSRGCPVTLNPTGIFAETSRIIRYFYKLPNPLGEAIK